MSYLLILSKNLIIFSMYESQCSLKLDEPFSKRLHRLKLCKNNYYIRNWSMPIHLLLHKQTYKSFVQTWTRKLKVYIEDTLTGCLVGKVFKRVGSDLAGVTDVIVRGNIDKVTGDIYGARKTESVLHNVNVRFSFFVISLFYFQRNLCSVIRLH